MILSDESFYSFAYYLWQILSITVKFSSLFNSDKLFASPFSGFHASVTGLYVLGASLFPFAASKHETYIFVVYVNVNSCIGGIAG